MVMKLVAWAFQEYTVPHILKCNMCNELYYIYYNSEIIDAIHAIEYSNLHKELYCIYCYKKQNYDINKILSKILIDDVIKIIKEYNNDIDDINDFFLININGTIIKTDGNETFYGNGKWEKVKKSFCIIS